MHDYLLAEQFVLDLRNITSDDAFELDKTYDDLEAMGLAKLPYDKVVVHTLSKTENKKDPKLEGNYSEAILSWFLYPDPDDENKARSNCLFSSKEQLINTLKEFNDDESFRTNTRNYLRTVKRSLITMLATKNAIKERHDAKQSQQAVDGKPHKKGSGGYTIIRPPESHEVEGGTHGSPRPHLRRGHIRKLHPEDKTRWVWVSPCFVNGEPEVARKAYLLQRSKDNAYVTESDQFNEVGDRPTRKAAGKTA